MAGPSSLRIIAVVFSSALLLVSVSGCGKTAWWAGKKIVQQEKQELAEKTGLSKTKGELRQEIKEAKAACDRDVAEMEKEMARQKEECARKEADLQNQLKKLKEDYDRKQAELEKALEKAP